MGELDDIKSPLPPRRLPVLDTDNSDDGELKINPITPPNPAPEPEPMTPPPAAPMYSSPAPLKVGKGNGLVVLAIILLLAAIGYLIIKVIIPGLKKTASGGEVTLSYWGLWEDPAIVSGVIADFEAENPGIKIDYVRNQRTNYRTRLQARLESAEGTEAPPDIFRAHVNWLPMFKSHLAGIPGDTVKEIGLETDFYNNYKNELKSGNNWVGVPLMYDGLGLFYNKDLIDSAQVNLPKSWWDLEMAANKLTVRDAGGKITVAGAALGLVDNVDQWSDIIGLMLKQGGVNPLSADPENEKKMQDVLVYYTLFRSKHQVWDESLPASTDMFAAGKLAFYFGPSWRVFNIEDKKIPDLKYEITTVPQLPTLKDVPPESANNEANLTNIHWSTYWFEGVNKKSEHQAEAWKFLQFLAKAENLEKMYTAASQARLFGEIYPRKSMASKMTDNPKTKNFVRPADNATSWYLASRTFDEGLNDQMAKYFGDAINSIVIKNSEPSKVMPDLRNGINQLIQKYGLK